MREQLQAERVAAASLVEALSADVESIVLASEASNADDEHDPEGATIAFERAQTMFLLERARRRLADLDAALDRLDTAAYGRCEGCGAPIGAERLVARPASSTCIDCARLNRL